MALLFCYDLENNIISEKDCCPRYGIRYFEDGQQVEIGDGYRHNICLDTKHWNRILKIIKDGELDEEGINSIVFGLMGHGLHPHFARNLIDCIKLGKIKPFE